MTDPRFFWFFFSVIDLGQKNQAVQWSRPAPAAMTVSKYPPHSRFDETRRRGSRRAILPCASDSGSDGRAGASGAQRPPASEQANPGWSRHARRVGAEARASPGRQCLILLNRAGAMTSTSEALAALPPFQVMSRVDLKVAAGGFKDSWKLGQGLRCVAPAARHPPSNVLRCPFPILAVRGVFPGDSTASASSPRARREPARPRSDARREDHAARPWQSRGSTTLFARDPR